VNEVLGANPHYWISLGAFLLPRLLVVALIHLTAYALGKTILKSASFGSLLEEIVISAGLGIGVLGSWVLLLGFLGLIYFWSLLALLATSLFIGRSALSKLAVRWAEAIRQPLMPARERTLAIVLAAIAFCFVAAWPIIILAAYPPIQFDELMYHLPLASGYAFAHSVIPLRQIRYWMLPQLGEISFTACITILDDVTVHFFVLSLLVLTCAAVLVIGRRFFSPRTGVLGVALFVGSPLVIFVGTAAFVDMAVVCFTTLSAATLLISQTDSWSGWPLLTGAFVGFAAASKYDGLISLLVVASLTLVFSTQSARTRNGLLVVTAALAAMAPTYLRTYFVTGNPLSPFLGKLFGFGAWDPVDVKALIAALKNVGVQRTFLQLLRLPWSLTLHQDSFGTGTYTHLTPIVFIGLPAAAVLTWRIKPARILASMSVAYCFFWFFAAQYVRYLLPVVPLACLCIAAVFDWGLARLKIRPAAAAIVTTLLFVIALEPGLAQAIVWTNYYGAPPTSNPGRRSFLMRIFPSYTCYDSLNSELGSGYTVYAFHDENMRYYAKGRFIGDWFGPGRYGSIERASGQQMYQSLRALGVTHLIVNTTVYREKMPQDSFFASHFQLLYEKPNLRLYSLGPAKPEDAFRLDPVSRVFP
jgi:hypothetical protein